MIKAAEEANSIVEQLSKGIVAYIEPDGLQTIRGVRVALGRAAKRIGDKLQSREANGLLYVEVLN